MFHMFERMNQPQVTDGQSLLPLLKGAVLSCSIHRVVPMLLTHPGTGSKVRGCETWDPERKSDARHRILCLSEGRVSRPFCTRRSGHEVSAKCLLPFRSRV